MILRQKHFLSAAALAAGIVLAPFAATHAMDYAGKTLKIVIPYGPGGTYDKYGQTFARHLGNHLPGKPNIIVVHMPGAGGVKAMNWMYNVMPKDGMNMITPLDNSVVNQLMRPEKMRFDAGKMRWLGTSNQTNLVLVVRSDTGVKTVADMKTKALVGGASGKNSTGYIGPRLAAGLLGWNIKMTTGYKGSSKTIFSVEQGETQMAMYNWLAWGSKVPHWFKGDKPFGKIVLQIGIWRDPDVPKSVPMLSDLVTNPEDKAVVAFVASLGALGRGLAMPPGVSSDSVATLRKGYDAMNADPAFEQELKKRKLRLIPATGAQIEKIVADSIKGATPAVVEKARKIIFGG